MTRHVAVIGAGPAGAAAARAMVSAGCQVTVFERADAIGGRTRTLRKDGYCLDTGAGFITNFYPRVMAAASELGFTEQVQLLERVTGLHDGERLALLNVGSVKSFLAFPLVTFGDKMKMSAWTSALTLKRAGLDLAAPESLMPTDTESIAEHARRRLNERIYQHLVRPGIEPFWYFSCEEVSASLAIGLTAHAAGAQFYFIKGGIDLICQHLLAGAEVRVGAPVTSVTRSDEGARVQGPDLDQRFDGAIVATPANVAVALTEASWGDFGVSEHQRDFLSTQRYAANVHVAFRVPRLAEDPGVNSVFPCGPGERALAALSFHRRKGGEREDEELISVYLSDKESLRVMDWPDDKLTAHAFDLARRIYPKLSAERQVHAIFRRGQAIPVHAVGRYQGAARFHRDQAAGGARLCFAGDYLTTATIDGAVESGLRAAQALAAVVSG